MAKQNYIRIVFSFILMMFSWTASPMSSLFRPKSEIIWHMPCGSNGKELGIILNRKSYAIGEVRETLSFNLINKDKSIEYVAIIDTVTSVPCLASRFSLFPSYSEDAYNIYINVNTKNSESYETILSCITNHHKEIEDSLSLLVKKTSSSDSRLVRMPFFDHYLNRDSSKSRKQKVAIVAVFEALIEYEEYTSTLDKEGLIRLYSGGHIKYFANKTDTVLNDIRLGDITTLDRTLKNARDLQGPKDAAHVTKLLKTIETFKNKSGKTLFEFVPEYEKRWALEAKKAEERGRGF